ncbi:MAG: serine/threonine protein kinase [Pirellulaceae bacterium]|nr:serine/threonine protein kinase [Pirellulaceae bacterium]
MTSPKQIIQPRRAKRPLRRRRNAHGATTPSYRTTEKNQYRYDQLKPKRLPARTTVRQLISGWEIGRPIGEGQTTVVCEAFSAHAPDAQQAVYTIKFLKEEFQRNRFAQEALIQEGRLGQVLNNPHVVSVLAAGLEQAPYYLVMPYLRGETLRDYLLERHKVDVPVALSVIRQITRAILALGDAGYVHLNLKPGKILISPEGCVTLLDLANVRLFDRLHPLPLRDFQGTYAYAAPERFSDRQPLTPSSDVYSLGILFYELLVGKVPFLARSVDDFIHCHREAPLPPFGSNVPPAVVKLIQRMTSKLPIRRPLASEVLNEVIALEIEYHKGLFLDNKSA